MSFDPEQIKTISNQALFTLIDNKKQAIETLRKKNKDSKKEEVEFCYLVRERQRRFYKRKNYPDCVIG
jgi:hypothetical protein